MAEKVRAVLLTKRFALGIYLQRRLAASGYLAGTVFEHRSRLPLLKRIAKRQGVRRTVDVLAYQIYDRFFRAGEFDSAVGGILGNDILPAAEASELEGLSVPSVNDDAACRFIAGLSPDLLIVHATDLLKPETYGLATRGALNLHCGVLPEYRGHDTIFWALAKRDRDHLGATIHLIDQGADTGAVLARAPIRFEDGDNDITVWIRSFKAGVDVLLRILDSEFNPIQGSSTRYPHYPHRGLSDYLHARHRW